MLHTFEELKSTGDQVVRLLQRAKDEQDWELCKELARFLMALDESGATLRSTLELVELKPSAESSIGQSHFTFDASRLTVPPRGRSNGHGAEMGNRSRDSSSASPGESPSGTVLQSSSEYFGLGVRNMPQ